MNTQMQRDVEELSSKLFKGDMTPIVFDLIKNTPYRDACLAFLGKQSQEIKEDEQQVEPAQDFASWFNSFKEVR